MQKTTYFSETRTSFLTRILAHAPLFEYKRKHAPLKMASEQYDYLQNSAMAVLKSAVRGVHVYRIFPKKSSKLDIRKDLHSEYKYSMGVYLLSGKIKKCL